MNLFPVLRKRIKMNFGYNLVELTIALGCTIVLFWIVYQCVSMVSNGILYRKRVNNFYHQRMILEKYLTDYSYNVKNYSVFDNNLYIETIDGSLSVSQGDNETIVKIKNANMNTEVKLNFLTTIDFKIIDYVNINYYQNDILTNQLVKANDLIEVLATYEAKDKEIDYVLSFNKKIYLQKE